MIQPTTNDIKMMLQLRAVIDSPENFIKYAAVRSVEMGVTENMRGFGFDNDTVVTLCDLTRWLMKNEPRILDMIDGAIKKMDQASTATRKKPKYFLRNNKCLNCYLPSKDCYCA